MHSLLKKLDLFEEENVYLNDQLEIKITLNL